MIDVWELGDSENTKISVLEYRDKSRWVSLDDYIKLKAECDFWKKDSNAKAALMSDFFMKTNKILELE